MTEPSRWTGTSRRTGSSRWTWPPRCAGPASRFGPPERGSGTVVTLGLVAVALLLLAVLSLLGRAQAARGAAQTAADLGALAAAQHLFGAANGPDVGTAYTIGGAGAACDIARDVVVRNGAVLTGCAILDGGIVRVSTARAGGPGTARAHARAGPGSPGLRPGPAAPQVWWPVVVPAPSPDNGGSP